MAIRLDPPLDDPGLALAMAMVAASTSPLLLLDGDFKVVAASSSFHHAFDLSLDATAGRPFFELGGGEWDRPQLRYLLTATASGDVTIPAYEMDLEREGQDDRRLSLNVQKLDYGDASNVRLLVAITDLTEVRNTLKQTERLLQDNALLMQEIRHRVANSLQIIANVLMQSARATQSGEARDQLRSAHHRVMSIADLQQQLAVSTSGTIKLRDYLTKLCETIAASMIPNSKDLTLTVVAQDVTIDAGDSVSLGLIVTELVINCLKHGFPDGAGGQITIDYQTDDSMWTLSVCDNGAGMPKGAPVEAGLGSSIVQALARQLGARVDVDDMNPGTKVSIVHPIETRPGVGGQPIEALPAV